MPQIVPYLTVNDASAAGEFYKRAFDATETALRGVQGRGARVFFDDIGVTSRRAGAARAPPACGCCSCS